MYKPAKHTSAEKVSCNSSQKQWAGLAKWCARLMQLINAFHFPTYPAHTDQLKDYFLLSDFLQKTDCQEFCIWNRQNPGNIEIEELKQSTFARVSWSDRTIPPLPTPLFCSLNLLLFNPNLSGLIQSDVLVINVSLCHSGSSHLKNFIKTLKNIATRFKKKSYIVYLSFNAFLWRSKCEFEFQLCLQSLSTHNAEGLVNWAFSNSKCS